MADVSERTWPMGSRGGLAAAPSGERSPAAQSCGPVGTSSSAHQGRIDGHAMSLHVSKLRGISYQVRTKLKQQGVTYTHQLLEAAGQSQGRRALAARSGIEGPTLMRLICRADLARIKGVGAIFADMLELIGVDRVASLAQQDPSSLHATLFELNAAERFARRAPTPEEVENWVAQARELPHLVEQDS